MDQVVLQILCNELKRKATELAMEDKVALDPPMENAGNFFRYASKAAAILEFGCDVTSAVFTELRPVEDVRHPEELDAYDKMTIREYNRVNFTNKIARKLDTGPDYTRNEVRLRPHNKMWAKATRGDAEALNLHMKWAYRPTEPKKLAKWRLKMMQKLPRPSQLWHTLRNINIEINLAYMTADEIATIREERRGYKLMDSFVALDYGRLNTGESPYYKVFFYMKNDGIGDPVVFQVHDILKQKEMMGDAEILFGLPEKSKEEK